MKLTRDKVKLIVDLHKSRNQTYIELYKKFFMWVMDRQIELDRKKETSWFSNVSSPITYMICMAVFGMYQDSKVAFEVYKTIKKAKDEEITDEEFKETERTNNAIISLFDSIYDDSDGSEEFDMSVLDAIILGNGFGGIGYEQSEDEYEVIGKDGKIETIEEKISMPNIYRIIPLNFYTEPSANSLSSSKFNIVRKIMTAERINKEYGIYGVKYTKKENEGEVLEGKDWNMVFRYMIFNNMPQKVTLSSLGISNTYGGNSGTRWDGQKHTDIRTDNSYKIGEDLNEVYEVHTDKSIQVFVNGKDIGTFKRLGPWKKKPFYKLGFRGGLNGLYDLGAGMLTYPFHRVTDAFLNLRIDNDRLTASQPFVVNSDESAFDGSDVLERYPGKIVKVKDINESIRPMAVQSPGSSAAQSEVDMLGRVVQEAVGVSGYKLGVQQKVERSARGVQELVEAADASMKSFIDSISKAKGFIAKYIVILALNYMDDESVEMMSGISDLKDKIEITDLIHDYTFNFDIQSVSSLRERQEVDSLKDFLRDFQGTTRPDGTPLINIDEAIKELIEIKRLNSNLYMDPAEAKEYMQEQIGNNAQLQGQEAMDLGAAGIANPEEMAMPNEGGIVGQPEVQQPETMGMPGIPGTEMIPGVQAGSAGVGMAQPTNPLGNNQISGPL